MIFIQKYEEVQKLRQSYREEPALDANDTNLDFSADNNNIICSNLVLKQQGKRGMKA